MRHPERLRVALFTYATQPRGGVLHALALGEALHDLGHDVVLFALAERGHGFIREPRCASVIVPIEASRGDTLGYVKHAIDAYVDAWNPATPAFDIYHAHDGISANALATLVERGAIPAYVRTVHHLDDFGSGELAALQARSIRSASTWLTVSRLWRERLHAEYGLTATVVPNGVDTVRFSPVPAAERAQLRRDRGYGAGPLFITIGGIEERKNTIATLEAFALARQTLPAARLVIAGGASVLNHRAYRREFDLRCAALGVVAGRELEITGVLSDVEIVALLRAADALVFPSLVEGFGLVILEALACATPVVTAALPPFTEFLSGADAILIDPGDLAAIAWAMIATLDPQVISNTARRGPQLASRFTWPASARAHTAAYTAFLAERHKVEAHA